jgi:diguanylate cyclase (GGDEF)-like protein
VRIALPSPNVRSLVVVGVLVLAAAQWFPSTLVSSTAHSGLHGQDQAELLLTGMLNQEDGLRGYLATGKTEYLRTYNLGREQFDEGKSNVLDYVGPAAREAGLVRRQADAQHAWETLAARAIALQQFAGADVNGIAEAQRKPFMDRIRKDNAELLALLEQRVDGRLEQLRLLTVALTVLVSLTFGGLGLVAVRRRLRDEEEQLSREGFLRESQREFSDALQHVRDESSVHTLLKRQLERLLPGSHATALMRNASDDRLESKTDPSETVHQALDGASPADCVAIRLGRPHREHLGAAPLLACAICGTGGTSRLCVPTLVGGQVIGSVLLEGEAFDEVEQDKVEDAVGQAAPVIGNLRTLALAERRAQTDVLTGLPNTRAAHDTLKRMVAQSGRAVAPLTAVMVDIDQFKRLNDLYGHDRGDAALAGVAAALRSRLRNGDYVARFGGEEFLVLLPATDRHGAEEVAEALRQAVSSVTVPGIADEITASFGVADLPDCAVDAETLLRAADRALYSAKNSGRNRVVVAEPPLGAAEPEPAGAAALSPPG